MKKQILLIGLATTLALPVMASRTSGGKGTRTERVDTAKAAEASTALRGANEALGKRNLPDIEMNTEGRSPESTSRNIEALEALKVDLAKIENLDRVSKLSPLIESANKVLAAEAKFKDAAKELPEVEVMSELSSNAINVLRSALVDSTSFHSISKTLEATVRLAEGTINKSNFEAFMREMAELGLDQKLLEIARCK